MSKAAVASADADLLGLTTTRGKDEACRTRLAIDPCACDATVAVHEYFPRLELLESFILSNTRQVKHLSVRQDHKFVVLRITQMILQTEMP